METKVELRKLQLLNDRITQVIEALNQVRFSMHGLQHTPGYGVPMTGPWAWGQISPYQTPYQPQAWTGPQPVPGGFGIPFGGPIGGLSHTGIDDSWMGQRWTYPTPFGFTPAQQWQQPTPWQQPWAQVPVTPGI